MVKISAVTFLGQPNNYSKIDNVVSRSAQPLKDDFSFLKKQGVTDVLNFRTMFVSAVDFDEKTLVEKSGMKYHNIPSITSKPEEKNILEFLNIVKNVKENNGKLHIHCKAGADRTGMYAFIYKTINKIGTMDANIAEWIARGHNTIKYPDLIQKTINLINKIKK